MNMLRSVMLMLIMAAVSAGGLQSCAAIDLPETEKTLYTSANIWYKHRGKILSVNRHRGFILPVGTKVKIDAISGRAILFSDEQGAQYRLILARKYTDPEFTIEDLFRQYFTENNPMGKNGAFQKLNDQERGLVKSGKISVGMSKEAVLMAYGYPPSHVTPSTNGEVWKYWEHKFRAYLVFFRNNRVSEIKKDL